MGKKIFISIFILFLYFTDLKAKKVIKKKSSPRIIAKTIPICKPSSTVLRPIASDAKSSRITRKHGRRLGSRCGSGLPSWWFPRRRRTKMNFEVAPHLSAAVLLDPSQGRCLLRGRGPEDRAQGRVPHQHLGRRIRYTTRIILLLQPLLLL